MYLLTINMFDVSNLRHTEAGGVVLSGLHYYSAVLVHMGIALMVESWTPHTWSSPWDAVFRDDIISFVGPVQGGTASSVLRKRHPVSVCAHVRAWPILYCSGFAMFWMYRKNMDPVP